MVQEYEDQGDLRGGGGRNMVRHVHRVVGDVPDRGY